MSEWIFIRGWGRGVGHWSDFPEKIRNSFPQDRFEFLELPGNGVLNTEPSPLTIAEMVQAVRRQSQLLKPGQKVRLVGISLGGMVVTEWARLHPEEVEFICVINSSAANVGRFYERLRPQNIPGFFNVIREKSIEVREQQILQLVSNSEERRHQVLASWVHESTIHPVPGKNFLRQLVAASMFRFPDRPPVKAFLIGSEQDRLVSIECTLRLAKAWDCPLFLHSWAGHDLPLDDAEWTMNCLKKMH